MILLCCYVGLFCSTQLHHSHEHAHAIEILHSEDHENDACHVTIYHPEQDKKCEHDLHFTTIENDCEYCEILNNNLQYNQPKINKDFPTPEYALTIHRKESFIIDNEIELSCDRGPPSAFYLI